MPDPRRADSAEKEPSAHDHGAERSYAPLGYLLVFAAAYVAGAGIGAGLPLVPGVAITFWPPAGVFLAALLLAPRRHWLGYVAVAAVADLVCNALWFHNPVQFALVYFVANALEALAAAWLLRRCAPTPFRFDSLREVIAFVGLGAGVAPIVGATMIATTDALLGKHPFTTAWPLVWLGDGAGLLVSTPIAFAVGQAWRERRRTSVARAFEGASVAVLLVLVAVLAFRGDLPTEYMTMPLVLWAAARFQLLGAAVAIAFVTVTTALCTATGHGEFAGLASEVQAEAVRLQTFLGVTGAAALLTATLSRLHQRSVLELAAANRELEWRVEERTDALSRERARLEVALRTGRMGVYEWRPQESTVWWSSETYAVYGVDPQSFRPTVESVLALVHPDDREELLRNSGLALLRNEASEHEYRILRADGTVRWIHNRSHLRPTPDGRSFVVTGVAIDITERRLTEDRAHEAALRERERAEELDTLLQNVPAAVWIATDPECRSMTGNPESYRYLQMREGENVSATAPGRSATDRPFEEYRDGVRVAAEDLPVQVAARTGRPVLGSRLTLRYRDGSERHIYGNAAPLFDRDGAPRGAVAAFIDLTEFIEAQTKLIAREQELATLARNIPDILARFDRELRHVFVGGAIEQSTGLKPAMFVGKSNRDLGMPDALRAEWDRALLEVFASARPGSLEFEFTTTEGPRHFFSRLVPELGDDGGVRTVLVIAEDVTERKSLEAELTRHRDHLDALVNERTAALLKAQDQLRLADRMAAVGTLAAGLAHDMKNLLFPLGVRMDRLLADPALPADSRTQLAVLTGLLDHLRAMARNLSLFSQDPQHDGVEGWTDLSQWCGQVRGFIDASIGPGVVVRWEVPADLPEVAVAPHRLTQAVQNLAHNARDAIAMARESADRRGERTGEHGSIVVRARRAGGGTDSAHVVVEVADNGCGMTDEVRRRCTEPFFTTKDRPASPDGNAGTGLGLLLAYSIVERVGGTMQIESAIGVGTTVTLTLPVARVRSATDPVGPAGRAHVSIEDKRTRALIVEMLRTLRYEVADGAPDVVASGTLWVTDGDLNRLSTAQSFLGLRPGQRVVVLGGDESWRAAGAIVCERGSPVRALRRAIMGDPE